jgi:hypothetical protein
MEQVMKNGSFGKVFTGAFVAIGIMSSTTIAYAQSASFGTNANLDLGDVKAAHASKGSVAVNGSNIDASGAVADGLRVGSNKVQAGVQGTVSAPAAAVGALLGD